MMKKRISILTLTILFLVSTTGLPIYSHYCEMMKQKSLSECEVCMVEMQKVETSCCEMEETSTNLTQLLSSEMECCTESFELKKIEDDFSLNVNTSLILSNIVVATIHPDKIGLDEEKPFKHQTTFNLPPPKFGKELLYTIHQLKIDLPVY